MSAQRGGSRRARLGAALAAVAAAAACAPGDPAPPPRSVVLVVVDTLRADRLGCYGAERRVTPNVDAFAAGAVRFERAYATAPWTLPSVGSILTGLHPHRFRTDPNPFAALTEEVTTLAEVFDEHGYSTGAVVSNFLLQRRFHWSQGFHVHRQQEAHGNDHLSSPGVTQEALALLERLAARERPFFLFVHYFDPHFRYRQHDQIDFAPPRGGRLDGTRSLEELRAMRGTLTPREIRWLRDVYDEEVRFTDESVGRLLDGLRTRGLADDVVVAFTSDHGEELLERGWLGHTRTLHDELVRVPLLLRAPGLAPRVVETPVSLVSLAPTLLDLAGVGTEGLELDGASWASALRERGEVEAEPVLLEVEFLARSAGARVENARQRGILWRGHKLVHDLRADRVALYDLRADPEERVDLAAREPERVRELAALLESRRRGSRFGEGAPAPGALDTDLREQLRELGYLTD